MHQAREVPVTYKGNEFDNLDTKLTLFSYSQADNNVLYRPLSNYLPPPSPESLALNNLNEIPNEYFDTTETSSLGDLDEFNEQLFSDALLAEPSRMDPFDDLFNEVTNTTTTSDAENEHNYDMVNNTRTEFLTLGVTETTTEKIPDKINLKYVPSSIQKQLLSVTVQPSINPRRRYQIDGKRRIKKLHSDLMTLDLSELKKYSVDPDEFLWLRLSLTTVGDNPLATVYIHSDELKYHSDQVRKQIDGSVCIPVPQSTIDKGKIELKDLSIIKTKDKKYNFKLIPYSLSEIDNKSETYVIDKQKGTAANAKIFRKKYNVKASQIRCQILIEKNESWCFTDIICETKVMTEQKYEPKETKPNKRLIKNNQKTGTKRRSIKKSKSGKQKKRSNY